MILFIDSFTNFTLNMFVRSWIPSRGASKEEVK
jgi:hypothetical protein